MNEIAKSVSRDGLCSMWALNLFDDYLYLAKDYIFALAASVNLVSEDN